MDDLAAPPEGYRPGLHLCDGDARISPGVSVLVAEHDEQSRRVMSHALAVAGYRVHQVTDGVAALEFLRRTRSPLIVTAEDDLPEIGGFVLAGLLSLKRSAQSRYSVIVLTEDLRTALRQTLHSQHRQLDAVALEILVKPFHVTELLLAVKMASERLVGNRPAGATSYLDSNTP